MVAELSVVGRPLGRVEGEAKVTGRARFAADVLRPGQLFAKCLRSPHPHARIVHLDVSAARRVPGVHAVLTGADLPRGLVGIRIRDMPLLARDRVRYIGERVVAIAAEDPDVAEEALSLVQVEYEELPAVFDVEAAMAPDAPQLHPDVASYVGREWDLGATPNVHAYYEHQRGDLARGLAEADLVIEHTFHTGLLHQGYLEPHAAVVALEGDGSAQVWMSNKMPFRSREDMAAALDLPEESINVHHVHIGGDFGGKGSPDDAMLTYHLARASGRPVSLVSTYTEELTAANPRHPATVYLKTGVKRDGTIVAREGRAIFNRGAYAARSASPRGVLNGVFKLGGSYRVPNARIEGFAVYTNQVPCGSMRAPGQPQVIFAVEAHMDLVAEAIGMDPLAFRLQNVLRDGDEPVVPARWQNVGQARAVLERAAEAIGWGMPKPPPTAKGGLVGRGLALSERGIGGGESHVELTLGADGHVAVLTGVPDIGTGTYTLLQQLVAEALGVAPERITVATADTSRELLDPGTGGSKSTHVVGQAGAEAARQMQAQLAERAAARLGGAAEAVCFADGAAHVDGRSVALGALAAEAGEPLRAKGVYDGQAPQVVSFVAQAVEVEVDPETGQVRVRRVASAHDVGAILNPLGHQGQVDGGVVMGVGSALIEGSDVDEGKVVAANLGDYKLATMADIPELITIHVEAPGGPAPFGGKSIGEEPFVPGAGAIANAVRDATGAPIFDLPIRPEDVLRGLRAGRPRA
jgi:CO/xanthine dehydrogenase Mo-binding subunit